MSVSNDATAAIKFLENLLKAKIQLQDAQTEAEPLLEVIGLLFEPEVLNDDQKNVLRNGLKNLRKLLEAHAAYSEAVQQAEPARAIVNQLLSSQPKGSPAQDSVSQSDNGAAPSLPEASVEPEPEAPESEESEPQKSEPQESKAEESKESSATKTAGGTKASAASKKS
ncbi:MAG: hypothetical protein HY785_21050 [Oscillatoriophycideae cyanobacterium NC_groundwater_1537_Pr4_S-0.65um_50_18]|nr:hypothetical protein [Oscillatoriophycideae cyanobacterium NC_groundwater_1537_Pr4_S-0.65um_50_18]